MSRRVSKPANMDGRLQPETKPQDRAGDKTAAVVPDHQASAADRAHHDARVHDQTLESLRGLTRAARDRDRSYPRPAGSENPRKRRRLPDDGVPRTAPTNYQCRVRSRTKRSAQSRFTQTEYDALNSLITDEKHWTELNTRLSEAYTAGTALAESDRDHVQRVDRAIRRFEERNDRGHLLYAPLVIDDIDDLDPGETEAWIRDHTDPGDRWTFDQFTAADHNPAKPAGQPAPVLLEITGNRGIYLGGAAADGNTTHLLPRGIQLEVTAVSTITVQEASGRSITKPTITLRILDP